MKKYFSLLLLMLMAACVIPLDSISQVKPIALNKTNPHYFTYKGKPTVLITSGEHYGAVINLGFDYVKYLSELQRNGLNLTRTFTGAYLEANGNFNIADNNLAPTSEKFICPWQRSNESGNKLGGNKFDLERWDDAYFTRLKDFISTAEKKGVIVELALFCPMYEESQWNVSPMKASNNINGVGNIGKDDVYTLDKNGGLLKYHDAMVRKIVSELKAHNNVIYEICNEPYFGGVTMEWQHHIASVISATEKELGVKHLISQNIANDSAKITNPHPDVSVFNFHYASPPLAVKMNYGLNKVIGNNETGFRGQQDTTYRKEGWQILLTGGALYNNLDYSFTVSHEVGDFHYSENTPGGGSVALRNQLGYLLKFMNELDFVRMKPDRSFFTPPLPPRTRVYSLSEGGKQYAAYFWRGEQVNPTLSLPAGEYSVEWMDPATGAYTKKESLHHKGGNVTIASPPFDFDVALRVVKGKK
jgi:hypothetical protein